MSNGYSRSPKLLKGALVHISEQFLGPVPNVIVFQYNPETLTRNLNPWQPPEQEEGSRTRTGRHTAQPLHSRSGRNRRPRKTRSPT